MPRTQQADKAAMCYKPSLTIQDFMQQMLRTERNKREGRGAASDDKELRRLARMKVYVLNDIIFPSMANVVYFLEVISKNPELQDVFDDDLRELFGLRISADMARRGHNPVIRRLVEALIDWTEQPIKKANGKDDDSEKMSQVRNMNIRLALMEIMQMVIYYKARTLSLQDLGADFANGIVNDDFGRAWMWTKLFAKNVEGDGIEVHRPARF